MANESDADLQPVANTRDVTVDALCEHFANDIMSVEEFERRVDAAHAATSIAALKDLLRDLPGGDLPGGDLPAVVEPQTTPTPAPDSAYTVTSAAHVKEQGFIVAIMGGSRRRGHWSPARKNYSIAVMGGSELDFREAVMPPGVTELQVFTICGGVDVIVPPGLNVESHGIAIMGGFEHKADEFRHPDPNAPTLKITGVAIMGGVDVTVRQPGERARDARRRRKLERKERRRLSKGG
jgi:hypothetical protein